MPSPKRTAPSEWAMGGGRPCCAVVERSAQWCGIGAEWCRINTVYNATRRPEAYALHPLALRDDQIYPAAHFLIDKAEHY